jgi:hypothetical protein
VEQGKTGGLAVEKGEQRLELPLGSEAIAAQIAVASLTKLSPLSTIRQ